TPNAVDKEPFAGVFWLFPAKNWGGVQGHAIDLTRFKQVRFFAAVEGPMPYSSAGGPGNLTAVAGGVTGAMGATHADGLSAASPALAVGSEVTSELKQFRILLSDIAKGSGCSPGA